MTESSHDLKLAFDSQEQAAAATTVAKHQYGSKKLKVYRCKKCSQWHIASNHES